MKHLISAASALAIAVTVVACGDTPTGPSPVTSSAAAPAIQFSHEDNFGDNGNNGNGGVGLVSTDASFLSFAAGVHRLFVALGVLAQLRGDLFEVKEFGLELYGKGITALGQLGETAGVGQQVTLTAAHQQIHDHLEGLSGSAFDRAFMEAVVRELQAAIREFGRQNGSLSSSRLRDHASNHAASMNTNLALARDLAGRVGACVATNGNGNGC